MMFELIRDDFAGGRREINFREMGSFDETHGSVQESGSPRIPVLSGVNTDHIYISKVETDHIVLGVRVEDQHSSYVCNVGTVASRRWVACAKNKLWWMTPSWGQDASSIPVETQFLLVELESQGCYAIVLPLIHEDTFTSMLRGGSHPFNRYVHVCVCTFVLDTWVHQLY